MQKLSLIVTIVATLLVLSACGSTSGMPKGAVAGCGDFEYTGTFTKSETSMRALWLSDGDALARLSVEDVVTLAEVMGCNRD